MSAPEQTVAAILAAGASRRFGGDKLLQPLAGKPLAGHIADTLAAIPFRRRIAICPAGAQARRALFLERGFEAIDNPDPRRGMGSSLALAAQAAAVLKAEAILICLADMPNVTAMHLEALLAALGEGDAAATEAAGIRSPPAVFSYPVFGRLAALTGDRGARDLLTGARTVTAAPELVRDFDTPADFD